MEYLSMPKTGDKMPIMGLGTWKSQPGEVARAVEAAIDAGYRHIDCAAVYGNETEVGEALKNKIGSTVKREDLWVTSKLWNVCHKEADVVPALQQTLKDLGLDYVDLYLIHWPHAFASGQGPFPKGADGNVLYDFETSYTETWKGMEEAVRRGLCKNIGVSNFNSKQLKEIMDMCTVPIANVQVECHPYHTQEKLLGFCRAHAITVTAYSPLGSPDRPWATPDEPSLLDDPRLAAVARKYNKSPAQVLIRFQIDRGVAVIPKSVNPARIKANFEVFDFKLAPDDIEAIQGFNRNFRFVALDRDKAHPHYPFNEEF